ncbi:N-acetylmuramoyl-L-alanine amidase family protein [Paenibacillus rubinfantis]|uniref:N-acetylmuramoyl-L-alanine amidase family protein n=1 Tax=Paenibacillus rubinfantis TaxID=1720296 RepID=UPI00073E1E46|nr:N-acetylmuramoyl-L-alanine amidase family protein [Paenibacillus rubinfantis]
MKKKGLAALMFAWMLLLVMAQTGHAASGSTTIYLDGKALALPKNGQVQNVNGNVMIPIRVVAEELGFDVNWEKKTSTVTIKQSGTTLILNVNKTTASVNGSEFKLAVAPRLVEDTTLVPMRFVSEQMGLQVSWDNAAKAAYLTTPSSGSGSGNTGNAGSGNDTGTDSGTGTDGSQPGTVVPPTDTANNLAQVTGIGFSNNSLMIAVDQNVTPTIFTMSGPERLVIDFPQAQFAETLANGAPLDVNKSGAIEVTDYPDVSKVRYAMFSNNPSTVRVVLDLNYKVNYQLINENDGLIVVNLNVDPSQGGASGGDGKKTVVLDAGHGGSDPGAISVTKKKEKDFNLAVVLKVQQLLQNEPNINLVLTRQSDTYPTLQDRVKIAEKANADIFISVHANSGSSTASGVETYYTRAASLDLAKVMHKHLVQASGLADRKVRTQSLHVTRETTMPAVLLECGYLSNKNDDALLATDEYRNKVAQGIVDGIKEYLGLQ